MTNAKEARISEVLAAIERRQTEQESATCGSSAMQERLRARRVLHEQVRHSKGNDLRVLNECLRIEQCFAGIPPFPHHWESWRDALKDMDIRHTDGEPPDLIYLMVSALSLLHANSFENLPTPTFILSTDCSHNAHGAVIPIFESCYEIRFGRDFLLDLGSIGDLVCSAIAEARLDGVVCDFWSLVHSSYFDKYFKSSNQESQMPYVLAALALGGKFRYHHFGTQDPEHGFEPCVALRKLCVCFLLGHELAHLLGEEVLLQRGAHVLRPYFQPESDRCAIDHINPKTLYDHWTKFGDKHSEEIGADWIAFELTSAAAVELEGDTNAALIACLIVLGVLAWIDRANHFMETHQDSIKESFHEHSFRTGLIDVRLPRSHPWGVTRLELCNEYIFQRYLIAPDVWAPYEKEQDEIVAAIHAIFFGEAQVKAMSLLSVGRIPGGVVCSGDDASGILRLAYFPSLENTGYFFPLETSLNDVQELWSIFRPLSASGESLLKGFLVLPPDEDDSPFRHIARMLGLDRNDR